MTSIRFSDRKRKGASRRPQLLEQPICDVRGYCGPFSGQDYYAMLETWAGFGTCEECRRTVPVPRHGAESGWEGWSPARAAAA